MAINEWWTGEPDERYWLETTGRADLGASLLAPQEDDAGSRENPGYVLLTFVQDGDVVLHYDLNEGALVGWSLAEGGTWAEQFEWASHPGGGQPYLRDHWAHGLKGPYRFDKPITLAELRAVGVEVGRVRDSIAANHRGSIYFPFTKYAGDWNNLRPGQPYMSKWPVELNDVVPGLRAQLAAARQAQATISRPTAVVPGDASVGLAYVDAFEDVKAKGADPFTTDPAVVERGLRGHARTQNELAREVERRGHLPLRPGPADPSYDLAWVANGLLHVAEVKSVTDANEDQQLRLGLGQVLWYRHLLSAGGRQVVAVLASERKPTSAEWPALCSTLGVRMTWPGNYDALD